MAEVRLVSAIRVRPPKESEGRSVWKTVLEEGSIYQTTAEGESVPEKAGSSAFRFDAVFDATSTTDAVYDRVAREIVDGVLHGVNGTVFAYGQTSSGKTYTMRGVATFATEQIFSIIEQRTDTDFLLRCSYIESYNDELRDLLSSSGGKPKLRENPHKGFYVEGASEEIVTDAAGILKLLKKGEAQRSVAATDMNERSSRSHTVFKVIIESKAIAGVESDGVLVGALSLVDLAGSESVRHTGATGQRVVEAGKINTSLVTLSRVITQLGKKSEHVSFRDSNLTKLLQPTLGGDARLAIICCVAPGETFLEETRSTLQFAQRAAMVRLTPVVHEVLDDASQLRRVKRQLAELQRKQREYEALGKSGKTEELSRLLDANNQLSEAVANKEAELSGQIEMISRLKRMMVLGGGDGRPDDDAQRLGEKGFITTRGPRRPHRKARETWAPGAGGPHVLFSATTKLPSSLFDTDDADLLVSEQAPSSPPAAQQQQQQQQKDLLVFDEDTGVVLPVGGGGAEHGEDSSLSSPVQQPRRRNSAERHASSPGAVLSAQFSDHRKRAAAQIAELRSELDQALARAEQAERVATDAAVELRAECAAADDDADLRQLPSLERPEDLSVSELCVAIRSRRERWRKALDAATDERAVAEREAYVLQQEVVELREVSESFDSHVAEIDGELSTARDEASELREQVEAARRELQARNAELANALELVEAAEESRNAALERLSESEVSLAERDDAAVLRRAAAVETVQRDAESLKERLVEADRTVAELRDEVDSLRRAETDLVHRRQLDAAESDNLKRDLAVKEARIARLEQVKMTTDIFKKIQQMQLEKARFQGENNELRQQLAELLSNNEENGAPKDSDSPFRHAAAALSRGAEGGVGSPTASPSTRLQLDELAARNAQLSALVDQHSQRLKSTSKLALDLVDTILREMCQSVDDASVTKLLRTDQDGILCVEDTDAVVAALAAAVKAAGGAKACDDAAAAKIQFLEQENYDLMLEIKDLRENTTKKDQTTHNLDTLHAFRIEEESTDLGGGEKINHKVTKKTPFAERKVNVVAPYDSAAKRASVVATSHDNAMYPPTSDGENPECAQS